MSFMPKETFFVITRYNRQTRVISRRVNRRDNLFHSLHVVSFHWRFKERLPVNQYPSYMYWTWWRMEIHLPHHGFQSSRLTSSRGMGPGSRSRGRSFVRIWLIHRGIEDVSQGKSQMEWTSFEHVFVARAGRVPNLPIAFVGRARVLWIFSCGRLMTYLRWHILDCSQQLVVVFYYERFKSISLTFFYFFAPFDK